MTSSRTALSRPIVLHLNAWSFSSLAWHRTDTLQWVTDGLPIEKGQDSPRGVNLSGLSQQLLSSTLCHNDDGITLFLHLSPIRVTNETDELGLVSHRLLYRCTTIDSGGFVMGVRRRFIARRRDSATKPIMYNSVQEVPTTYSYKKKKRDCQGIHPSSGRIGKEAGDSNLNSSV